MRWDFYYLKIYKIGATTKKILFGTKKVSEENK